MCVFDSHPSRFNVAVIKVSDEAERSPLFTVSVNWNWSKLSFRTLAGNVSTAEEVEMLTTGSKQEAGMELRGLHVQL